MYSNFAPKFNLPVASSSPSTEETYNLAGLNMRDPDELITGGESPFTINSRMYARNDGDTRVANRTRKGASYLSTPIGETLNVQNVGAVVRPYAIGTLGDGNIRTFGQQFTPNVSGALTRADIEINKAAGITGHIIVEVRADNSGAPAQTVLAQGSILSNVITTSMTFLPAYFIDAPALVSGTPYWLVWYVQDNGVGDYYSGFGSYFSNITAGSHGFVSYDGGQLSWGGAEIAGDFRYKTYISTAGGVDAFHLRYPSDPTKNLIMFAQNGNLYSVPKSGGVPTLVSAGLSSTQPIRFFQFDDRTGWVDNTNVVKWWNGTTVTNMSGTAPVQPFNCIVWQNRLFLMSANNRVDFSDLNDPTSWTNTNFFYVPAPLSPDHMTGWRVFQSNLIIFTHKTKHKIIGSDISTFTRKEVVGTKGAVSQDAMDADRNAIYFMADDKQVYAFNGVADVLLSEKVETELQSISDVSQVRIHVYRNQVRVYYPKSPSSTTNRMLLYDLELKQWFMDTDHPVLGSAELYLDKNELVEFSNQVGQVMFGETQFSDLGKKLDWQFFTNYKTYAYRRRTGQTFGGGSAKKRIKRFRPIVRVTESPYPLLVGKDMDFVNNPDLRTYRVDGGGAKWGSFHYADGTKWGGSQQIQNRAGMSGRGNHIQYRFARKGVETPVELYGYIAQYKVGRQK